MNKALKLLAPMLLLAAMPLVATAAPDDDYAHRNLEVVVTVAMADMFPSQTCWGQTFDIAISGLTGNLEASCHGDSTIAISIAIWEEDGGWLDPNDRVVELWFQFPTGGLTSGVPYSHTFEDVHLADWCDEYDWEGEFFVEVKGPCLASTLVSDKEIVRLLFYPRPPALAAPANGDTTSQPVTLQWQTVAYTSSYQVQLADENTFASPLVDVETGSLSHQIPGLIDGTTYYWRVRAQHSTCPEGGWSATRSFVPRTATAVAEIQTSGLPSDFTLGPNYPNPFNPSTRIEFALPHACHVKLGVYNVAGQKVGTLVDQELAAGYKVVTWDGTDEGGSPVASGIYFYRVIADDFRASRRMILVR